MRFHVRAGATKGNAADDFLAKVHDSDLVKTTGFVNGQWVAAEDGSTIEVSPSYHVFREFGVSSCNAQLTCTDQAMLSSLLFIELPRLVLHALPVDLEQRLSKALCYMPV